jgi:hypothetical protein
MFIAEKKRISSYLEKLTSSLDTLVSSTLCTIPYWHHICDRDVKANPLVHYSYYKFDVYSVFSHTYVIHDDFPVSMLYIVD